MLLEIVPTKWYIEVFRKKRGYKIYNWFYFISARRHFGIWKLFAAEKRELLFAHVLHKPLTFWFSLYFFVWIPPLFIRSEENWNKISSWNEEVEEKASCVCKTICCIVYCFFLFLRTLHRVVENITVEKKKGEKNVRTSFEEQNKKCKK